MIQMAEIKGENVVAIFASMFVSTIALACPHLAGNYVCPTDSGKNETLQVTENFTGQFPTYEFNGSQLIVDGVPHALSGDSTMRNGMFRATCDSVSLISEMSGQYFEGEKKLGEFKTTATTIVKSDALVETVTGIMTNAEGTLPINDQSVCNRYALLRGRLRAFDR